MSIERDIKESIKHLTGSQQELFFPAEVVSIGDKSCEASYDGIEYHILLCAIDSIDNSLVIRPKVGSTIQVADLSGGEKRILLAFQYTEIENIEVFGGEKGGMCNTLELKKQLDVMSKRIDSIIDALSQSPTAAQDGGAAYKSAISSALASLDKEDFSEIEDTRIKH